MVFTLKGRGFMNRKIIFGMAFALLVGVAIVYAQNNAPKTIERWEYTILEISGMSFSSAIQRANQLGEQGWEHAEGIPGNSQRMLFKRRLQ